MTEKKINIYVDMDGVQAVYGFGDSVEDMAVPGYFRDRPAHTNMVETVKRLDEDPRYHVVVLSSVFADEHSISDKQEWLDRQGLSQVEACFVPFGRSKVEYARKDEVNILIDDFSRNLMAWEAAGENYCGIKFLNEKNGSHGSWFERGGYTLSYRMTSDKLFTLISGIAAAC